MREAVVRFNILNGSDTTSLEHACPVPSFLCQPHPDQKASAQFYAAFIDFVSIVTAQHHEECMTKITAPCLGCGKLAKDALKLPMSYLHLAEPMVVVQILPVCGATECERKVRAGSMVRQQKIMAQEQEEDKKIFLSMNCDVCKKPNSKRCAGCNKVAYCSQACQAQAWKAHKRECHRKKVDTPLPEKMAFDAI